MDLSCVSQVFSLQAHAYLLEEGIEMFYAMVLKVFEILWEWLLYLFISDNNRLEITFFFIWTLDIIELFCVNYFIA